MDNPISTPKRSKVLLTVQILVGLFYGALLMGGIVAPLTYHLLAGNDNDPIYYWVAETIFVICMMAMIGMVLMYFALRSTVNRLAVEIWTMVALGVAPFSAYFYLTVAAFYLGGPRGKLLTSTNIIGYVFGFYLPFVLLTLWVRYRCREDEF